MLSVSQIKELSAIDKKKLSRKQLLALREKRTMAEAIQVSLGKDKKKTKKIIIQGDQNDDNLDPDSIVAKSKVNAPPSKIFN